MTFSSPDQASPSSCHKHMIVVERDPVTGELVIPLSPEVIERLDLREGEDMILDFRDGKTFLTKAIAGA